MDAESPEQLQLFQSENQLRDRFEDSFFKRTPELPGVYWMSDRKGRTVYVGKAKNLRARLRSYRGRAYEKYPEKTRAFAARSSRDS
jgi:excinuclease UvrABC nuclease subunit